MKTFPGPRLSSRARRSAPSSVPGPAIGRGPSTASYSLFREGRVTAMRNNVYAGGPLRRIPEDLGGRSAVPRESARRGPRVAGEGVRDQRPAGAGVPRTVRGDLRSEECAGASAEHVRLLDPGGHRHRHDEEPGADPRRLLTGTRREIEAGRPPEVRVLLHPGEPGGRADAPAPR